MSVSSGRRTCHAGPEVVTRMLKRLGPDISVKGQVCPAHTPDPFALPALTIADTPVATAASASAAACARLISLAQVTHLVYSKLLYASNVICAGCESLFSGTSQWQDGREMDIKLFLD